MRVKKIDLQGSNLIDLNYNLTIDSKIRIPKDIEGAIVRVNVKVFKRDISLNKIEEIVEQIKANKPELVFTGEVKTIIEGSKRDESKMLSLKSDRCELVQEFIMKFAPEELRDVISDEASEIMQALE